MRYRYSLLLFCISYALSISCNTATADEAPIVNTFVDKNTCNIKANDKLIASYKCEYSRAPTILSYSYLYEASKKILVFIDSPMGNACDGGPLHVFAKTDDEEFKHLKTIDFCGGHYPSITSGPETFKINIPSIAVDGTSKKIPAETWELKNNELIKR